MYRLSGFVPSNVSTCMYSTKLGKLNITDPLNEACKSVATVSDVKNLRPLLCILILNYAMVWGYAIWQSD